MIATVYYDKDVNQIHFFLIVALRLVTSSSVGLELLKRPAKISSSLTQFGQATVFSPQVVTSTMHWAAVTTHLQSRHCPTGLLSLQDQQIYGKNVVF